MSLFRVDSIATGDPSCVLLELRGPIDGPSVGQLQTAVEAALRGGAASLILDMMEVKYISSSGIRALVASSDLCSEAGGTLAVKNPSEEAQYIIKITGLEDVVIIEE